MRRSRDANKYGDWTNPVRILDQTSTDSGPTEHAFRTGRARIPERPRTDFELALGLTRKDNATTCTVMKTYGQFCPVAMALEVLAERWTLLVVRELLCGSRRFNELSRGVPQMSRTMLSQRLKTLEDAGVVLRVPAKSGGSHEYCLTQAGEELRPIVVGLGTWGQRWASQELKDEHLDASLLMWDMHRRIDLDAVPRGRIVIRFDFKDAPAGQRRYWLKLEDGEADVCFTDPGFDVQAVIETSVRTLTDIWMGKTKFSQALRSGELSLEGKRTFVRQLPGWLQLSVFSDVELPA